MPKNDESFRDRLRKITLVQWGAFCMFSGGFAGVAGMLQPAKNQAELLGRGVAVMLFWVAGIVLVILHFVRRGRNKQTNKRPTSKTTGTAKRKSNGALILTLSL